MKRPAIVFAVFCFPLVASGQSTLFRSSECWSTSITESVFCRLNATPGPEVDVFASPEIDDERFQPAFPERSRRVTRGIALSDQQIRQILVRQSIVAFAGSCACPYFSNADGSLCGGDSAWSQREAGAPLCYDAEVDTFMIRNYRQTHP